MKKKKHIRRKVTQEQVNAINRKRDLVEGTERSYEYSTKRVVVGPDGRACEVDASVIVVKRTSIK